MPREGSNMIVAALTNAFGGQNPMLLNLGNILGGNGMYVPGHLIYSARQIIYLMDGGDLHSARSCSSSYAAILSNAHLGLHFAAAYIMLVLWSITASFLHCMSISLYSTTLSNHLQHLCDPLQRLFCLLGEAVLASLLARHCHVSQMPGQAVHTA